MQLVHLFSVDPPFLLKRLACLGGLPALVEGMHSFCHTAKMIVAF